MGVRGCTGNERLRTIWTPEMDRYFIDLMLEQVRKGNKIEDHLFSKRAWKHMISLFNTKFRVQYEKDVLKNRHKTLRNLYKAIKNLLEQKGFSWDATRQMVTAENKVWDDYIKAHTDARQYMTRPVPYYKDLCLIWSEINVDGRESLSGHEFPNKVSKDSESPDALFSSDSLFGEENESSYVANKRQLDNTSNSSESKKARNRDEGMVSALCEMATAVSSLADKRKDDEDSVPIETVIKAIQSLSDMDEELVLDACDFLEDEKKAKTFLALDVKLRKKWLMRKLRPQQQQ